MFFKTRKHAKGIRMAITVLKILNGGGKSPDLLMQIAFYSFTECLHKAKFQPVTQRFISQNDKFENSCCFCCLSVSILSLLMASRKRGAVVEWLEQLGYGAESRRIA